jgi:hypothetical protein
MDSYVGDVSLLDDFLSLLLDFCEQRFQSVYGAIADNLSFGRHNQSSCWSL